MDFNYNDQSLNQDGQMNTRKIYFIQRWIECLHTNTHSSYSIKYLNSHLALKELLQVTELYREEAITNETHLKLLIEEVKSLINSDNVFKKNASAQKKILDNSLQPFNPLKDKSKLFALDYQVRNVVSFLGSNYLKWIIEEIKDFLSVDTFVEDIESLDSLIVSLLSELLGKGWSTKRLFTFISNAKKYKRCHTEEFWDFLFKELTKDPETFICLFPLQRKVKNEQLSILDNLSTDSMLGEEVLKTYETNNLADHIKNDWQYVRVIIDAYDYDSAITAAWKKTTEQMDLLRFYNYPIQLKPQPLVIHSSMEKLQVGLKVKLIQETKKKNIKMEVAVKAIQHSKDILLLQGGRRINSLYEFSRLSKESLSPVSTYLNLWIALESFVETKEYTGDIEGIKKIISPIVSTNYISSLIDNFYKNCEEYNIPLKEIHPDFISVTSEHQKVRVMLSHLLDDDLFEKLLATCKETNTLLYYRCKKIQICIKEGKSASKLLTNHEQRVSYHLQRLYRVRNSIVHTAQETGNLTLFINHLNEYLFKAVSSVVDRTSVQKFDHIEEVFSLIKDNFSATKEILNNSKGLDKEDYINLLLEGAF